MVIKKTHSAFCNACHADVTLYEYIGGRPGAMYSNHFCVAMENFLTDNPNASMFTVRSQYSIPFAMVSMLIISALFAWIVFHFTDKL